MELAANHVIFSLAAQNRVRLFRRKTEGCFFGDQFFSDAAVFGGGFESGVFLLQLGELGFNFFWHMEWMWMCLICVKRRGGF